MLFHAKYAYRDDTGALDNPYIIGALYRIYWSEIETAKGECDWSNSVGELEI